MMDIFNHKKEFDRIIKEHKLDERAAEVADFVTGRTVSVDDFSEKFSTSKKEAEIILSFIHKGIRFKEEHIDAKNQKERNNSLNRLS